MRLLLAALLLAACGPRYSEWRCDESHTELRPVVSMDMDGHLKTRLQLRTVCDCWRRNTAEADPSAPCVDR